MKMTIPLKVKGIKECENIMDAVWMREMIPGVRSDLNKGL